jgi:hypothetical protein
MTFPPEIGPVWSYALRPARKSSFRDRTDTGKEQVRIRENGYVDMERIASFSMISPSEPWSESLPVSLRSINWRKRFT